MKTAIVRIAAAATLAVVLATAGACSKRSKSPSMARVDREAIVASTAPANILDYDLRNKVAADQAEAFRLADGRLEVRVNLRNSTRKDLDVLARCVFKTENGLSLGDETEWQPIFFAPQQIQTYIARSRNSDARVFTVEVRKP